ncbi:MAG: amino acid/polyamine/organocation transporter, superfamily, partial [Bacteriovoracaceae bacterium]|nr:amino acid/polyamine/organocation transporter, superfamily [Bacteriovoracaceae bacterium]
FATNATFAVMFADYLGFWIHLTFWTHWMVALILIWGSTYINFKGISFVGESSIWMTALILLPFIIMSILGIIHFNHNPFVPLVHPEKSTISAIGESLMLAVWLYSGYDKITVSAGEIENPRRNIPLALVISIPLVALSYIIPTFAALAGSGQWADWKDSYFSTAAQLIGGPWLGHSMTLAALISNALLLNATMLAQSRLPIAMAKDKLFPQVFNRLHPRFGTPTISLIVGSVILSLLCVGSFTQLVAIYSVTQMLSYLLIYATFLKMRKLHPEIKSPFRIRGGTLGFLCMIFPAVCIAIFTLVKTDQLLLPALALLSGPVAYFAFRERELPALETVE